MKKFFKFLPALVMMASTLVGCGPSMKDFVDYANNGAFQLQLDYKDRNFFDDGIGQVTLKHAIDGDTAHFIPSVADSQGRSKLLKSRFYGINTPESTSEIQPWGQPASNFTKEKLKQANEHGTIVVSSPFEDYGTPEPDSTGQRYLSLVWINLTKKNAPINELVCLNLWIAQEGLCIVQNVGEMPSAEDTFYAAGNQAQKYKLNMWSEEPDPTFPTGEYQVTSILKLKRETQRLLADPNDVSGSPYNNRKVVLVGAVAGYVNRNLYLQDFFDEELSGTEGGEYASINIFCGMSPIPTRYQTFNTYLEIHGTCKWDPLFGFQITDVKNNFPVTKPKKDTDTKILKTADENVGANQITPLKYSAANLDAEITNTTLNIVNCLVEVTDILTVTKAYINDDGEASLTVKDHEFGIFLPFSYSPNPDEDWYIAEEKDFVNHTFKVKGIFAYHYKDGDKEGEREIVYQLYPGTSLDLERIS